MIYFFYREMLRRKIQPDTFTFNIMIQALCKVHKVDEAYHMVQKMGAKCCTPYVFTYNILAKGFCEYI
jgi:pentatricopeptide repeat protein